MTKLAILTADADLGRMTDTELARRHGVSRELVRQARVKTGVPTYTPPPKVVQPKVRQPRPRATPTSNTGIIYASLGAGEAIKATRARDILLAAGKPATVNTATQYLYLLEKWGMLHKTGVGTWERL